MTEENRTMHDITCSVCGNPGQVPFKPFEGSTVKCRDCYTALKNKEKQNE